MPRYFAKINKQDVVETVIVADSLEWCEQNLGGEWKETFIDDPNKNYAGIGHILHRNMDNFSTPKPFDSWVLDDKAKWVPPVERTDENTKWDETSKKWVAKDLSNI